MASYHATIKWARGEDAFVRQKYSRGHTWHFDEGVTVPASASPQVLRPPLTVEAAVDPEEALVAALSSCHMLFVLSYLSKAGFVVETYEDAAEAQMEKRDDGRVALVKATLRPHLVFHSEMPSPQEFAEFHERAHEECYIANSVNFPVEVQPTMEPR